MLETAQMREAEQNDEAFEAILRKAASVGTFVPPPRAGEVIAERYRIEEVLGRGGMGVVFRATHLLSEKPVAIKWMLRSASDPRAYRRFMREARIAGRIDHPNVVNVYDIVQRGDACFLVMELLHGESLRERLRRAVPSVTETINLLLPALRGVLAAHQAGIVHRDLKPENIFLCRGPDGAPREAKVLDFGIAAITVNDSETALTQEGAVIGTPSYIPPEQLQNGHVIDGRADVYAFGVILYEMLTGQLPLAASSCSALLLAIMTQSPRRVDELRPEIPLRLADLVARALAKRPDDRFATLAELIDALLPFAAAGGAASNAANAGRPKHHKRLLLLATLAASAVASTLVWAQRAHDDAVMPVVGVMEAESHNLAVDFAPIAQPQEAESPSPAPTAPASDCGEEAPPTSRATPHRTPRATPNTPMREAAKPTVVPRAGPISVDQL